MRGASGAIQNKRYHHVGVPTVYTSFPNVNLLKAESNLLPNYFKYTYSQKVVKPMYVSSVLKGHFYKGQKAKMSFSVKDISKGHCVSFRSFFVRRASRYAMIG